uniref:Uncharacterized protein n=1 Tax=Tetranychus urticae TaxID=32264 RepID=T1K2H9_TETUR
MMSVEETLMCSFQVPKYQYGGLTTGRPVTPPRGPAKKK